MRARDRLGVLLLLAALPLTACGNGDPAYLAQSYISQRDFGNADWAVATFSDNAVVGAANLRTYTGRDAIKGWIVDIRKRYFYKVAQPPRASGNQVRWVDDLYAVEGSVWVGELSEQATVEAGHFTHLDVTLLRGATGVICPLCPPMCPNSDTPNLPCH